MPTTTERHLGHLSPLLAPASWSTSRRTPTGMPLKPEEMQDLFLARLGCRVQRTTRRVTTAGAEASHPKYDVEILALIATQ